MRLALLLILAAVPARAQDDAAFLRSFYAECLSALGELETTKGHRTFLLKHKIDLEVTAEEDKIPSSSLAQYRDVDNKMYINKATLDQGRRELGYRAVDEAEIPRLLAWKLLPTLAHEIRHAMTHDKIRRRLGFSFPMPSLESEMISFVDTVRVLQDAIRKRPDDWKGRMILEIDSDNGELLAAWRKNPAALKELVKPLYPNTPSVLDLSRQELLGQVDDFVKDCSDAREEARKAQKEIAAIKEPEARAKAQKAFDESGEDRRSREELERAAGLRLALTNARNYKGLRAFFREQIRGLVRLTP